MHALTSTPEVQRFLDLIQSGQSPSQAAKQSALNPHEAILIRKLAGLPVNSHQPHIPEKVAYLRSQGLTYKQIAQHLNISLSYVNIILQRHRKQSR
ncbi:helix-turn-helix domain-containing protein [Candidatus Pantoea bituminis]|uniref:helix-turn-helix domain-containing protein n=1 Tax=Candidatus Pantoea bituminis TaxID=2831036 RepID=UPI001C061635